MARIRSIKPELWHDERIGTLPIEARLLFIGLISHADDEGRLRGNPLLIRSLVFPYDPDVDVERGLALLAERGRIVRYDVGGERYIQVVRFVEHQRIEKPKPSAFPAPTPPQERSATFPGAVPDASEMSPGRKGVEGKGEEGSGSEAEAPPPVNAHALPDIRRPESSPETWSADDFWAWAQDRRRAGGLSVERRKPKDLGRWYSAALMSLGGKVAALQEAFYRFGENEYWQGRDPPLPFSGFVSQWDRFLPPGVTRAAS